MKIKILTIIVITCLAVKIKAQEIEVLTLGTFHFDFPNMDIKKVDSGEQIDVLSDHHQNEIKEIVAKIARFKPSIIAIEVSPKHQKRTDSLYKEYVEGNYELSRKESEQIGFRLAKQFKLDKLYCTNDWGTLPEEINEVVYGNDSIENSMFMDYFYNNPDSLIFFEREYVFKTEGILEELRQSNLEENLRKDLGNYLISVFKYESEDNPFFGVDFTTGWWFNRNLRIFRNIQRIPTQAGDKILVIFGTGHMNLLNVLFEASPEYDLVNVNDYLE